MLITPCFIKPVNTVNTNRKEEIKRYKSESDCFCRSNIHFKSKNVGSGIPQDVIVNEILECLSQDKAINLDDSKGNINIGKLESYRSSWDKDIKKDFCSALKTTAEKKPELKPDMVKILDLMLVDNKEEVRHKALESLSELVPFKDFLKYIKHPMAYEEAGSVLLKNPKNDKKAVLSDLKSALNETSDSRIKGNILILITKSGGNDQESLKLITSYLKGKTKADAILALGNTELKGNQFIIKTAMNNINTSHSPEVRIASLITLRKIVLEPDNEMVKAVSSLVSDKSVRTQAIETLGVIGKADVKTATDSLLRFVRQRCKLEKGRQLDNYAYYALRTLDKFNPQKVDQLIKNFMIADVGSSILKYQNLYKDKKPVTEKVKKPVIGEKYEKSVRRVVNTILKDFPNKMTTDDKMTLIGFAITDIKNYHSHLVVKAIEKTISEE